MSVLRSRFFHKGVVKGKVKLECALGTGQEKVMSCREIQNILIQFKARKLQPCFMDRNLDKNTTRKGVGSSVGMQRDGKSMN